MWFANSIVDSLYLTYVTARHSCIRLFIHLFSQSLTHSFIHSLIRANSISIKSFTHFFVYFSVHYWCQTTLRELINIWYLLFLNKVLYWLYIYINMTSVQLLPFPWKYVITTRLFHVSFTCTLPSVLYFVFDIRHYSCAWLHWLYNFIYMYYGWILLTCHSHIVYDLDHGLLMKYKN